MKQLTYKTQWRAFERIREALQAGILISWYGTDHAYVVLVRRDRKRRRKAS